MQGDGRIFDEMFQFFFSLGQITGSWQIGR
jgi:hypothetical protein